MLKPMNSQIKSSILSVNSTAPRYTSYPPATAFEDRFGARDYGEWLEHLPNTPLSLYYHIPFCRRLCYYCGCHTNICNDSERLAPYVQALQDEMDIVCRHLHRQPVISHIHFGGGSPTILPPALFRTLMQHIQKRFFLSKDIDIAIEADPRQLNEALIATYVRNGVTRISLGVQDFDDRVLTAVNRPQPFYLSWDAVSLCREYGIKSINLDLMYGLPGQTVKSLERTIDLAFSLKPDRISFFGYAHVPWMKKHMRMMGNMPLPDGSLRYDLYETGRQILEENGYLPVGIDHFVRPSDSMAKALGNRTLKRNFQGYTTDTADSLIGFGASAIGQLPQGFVQNTPDILKYQEKVNNGHLPIQRGYCLNDSDRIYSDLISEIMCYMAVDLAIIRKKYHLYDDFFDPAIEKMGSLLKQGLITLDGDYLRIHHPHIARVAAACFDPKFECNSATMRHSSAV